MPLLLCWRLNRHAIRNLIVRRVSPNRLHAGQPVNLKWEVTNHGQVSAYQVQIKDSVRQICSRNGEIALKRKRDATKGLVIFDDIPVGESVTSSFQVLFAERGTYETGPAYAICDFPLGLVSCWVAFREPEQIHVAPKIGHLAHNWRSIVSSVSHGTAARACVEGAQGDDFFAVREWRSGDNKKKIHWRSTAKYRTPMVRQFERETEQDTAIVLDLCADSVASDLAADFNKMHAHCEHILSFATTVLSNWGGTASGQLAIGIAGENGEVLSSLEHGQFTSQAMRSLAIARAGNGRHLESVLQQTLQSVSSETPCLVISSRSFAQASRQIAAGIQERIRWVVCDSRELQNVFSISDHLAESKLKQFAENA